MGRLTWKVLIPLIAEVLYHILVGIEYGDRTDGFTFPQDNYPERRLT